MFDINSPVLFGIAALVIAFVLGQSVFFLNKAWTEAQRLGIAKSTLKRIALSAAVFTIAPAIAILIGLLSLSKFLGLPLPWLRLSVLGALTYELPAAASVAKILNLPLDQPVTSAAAFNAMVWVMTMGIMSGILVILFFQKSMVQGLGKVRSRDEAWSKIFMDSLFIGMISAFLGMIFSEIGQGLEGMLPIFVLLASALVMAICGLLIKKLNWQWLESYALPISMLASMAFAVVLTQFVF
ncbi:MAG: DUF5058 family protein [Tissierellia bacterium]|nr:DUF5058 family protein [Tissierellia bacterium]